ncbi:MAG: NAD(P)-dependent oxidoreductase, partial [Candidatus Entotheonellia bacterium]
LVTESGGFSARAAEMLRSIGDLVLADLDRNALLCAVADADVLWVRLRHRIDAGVIAAAPRLQVIVSPTTGLNHIDLEEADRAGIRVVSLRGEVAFLQDVRATAEHTLALILALLRQVPGAAAHVRKGGWNRDRFKGHELHGKTAGVVGYGRLGRIVARYLQAFDMRVLAADPHVEADVAAPDVTLVPLAQLLPEADLVTLHVNLCAETAGFFGQSCFAMMREGAWFINTSRGELIDEGALLDALCSGRLAGAALDVLREERPAGMGDHLLVAYARTNDHLLLTPHVAGCTVESMEKTELFLAERLVSLLTREDAVREVVAGG